MHAHRHHIRYSRSKFFWLVNRLLYLNYTWFEAGTKRRQTFKSNRLPIIRNLSRVSFKREKKNVNLYQSSIQANVRLLKITNQAMITSHALSLPSRLHRLRSLFRKRRAVKLLACVPLLIFTYTYILVYVSYTREFLEISDRSVFATVIGIESS